MCDGGFPYRRANSSAWVLYELANSFRNDQLYRICAYLFRLRKLTTRLWQCLRSCGHLPSVNGSEKLRCNPISNSFAVDSSAARSESAMKTMALTDVILLSLKHLRAASVSAMERPQSSALMISIEGRSQTSEEEMKQSSAIVTSSNRKMLPHSHRASRWTGQRLIRSSRSEFHSRDWAGEG